MRKGITIIRESTIVAHIALDEVFPDRLTKLFINAAIVCVDIPCYLGVKQSVLFHNAVTSFVDLVSSRGDPTQVFDGVIERVTINMVHQ